MAELPEALADRFKREVAAFVGLCKTNKGLAVAFVIVGIAALGFHLAMRTPSSSQDALLQNDRDRKGGKVPKPPPEPDEERKTEPPVISTKTDPMQFLLPANRIPEALIGSWQVDGGRERWTFRNGNNQSNGFFETERAEGSENGRYNFELGNNIGLLRLSQRRIEPTGSRYLAMETASDATLVLVAISADKSGLAVQFIDPLYHVGQAQTENPPRLFRRVR